MENMISSSLNTITVHNDDLNTFTAVMLMESLSEMHRRGRKEIVLDLGEVQHYSSVGMHVILSAMEMFSDLQLEGVIASMRNKLTRTLDS